MKKGFFYSILMTTLLCSNVIAVPISIGLSSFSGTETVINFNSIGNEIPITNQFSAEGVTFNGALYGMTSPGDINLFPNTGNVAIASNWIYGKNPALQGDFFSATFDNIYTKVGFYLEMTPGDEALVNVSYSGVSSGSLTFSTGSASTIFVGLEESFGFNNITMTVVANLDLDGNGFFAIDDFRFEGTPNTGPGPNPVPEPSTILLLSIGLTGLMGLRKKLIH